MKYMLLIYEDDAERVAMMDERMPTCAAYADAISRDPSMLDSFLRLRPLAGVPDEPEDATGTRR